MITLNTMAGALLLCFALIALAAVSIRELRRDVRELAQYLDEQGPVQLEKDTMSRLMAVETQLDKLQDAYNRLRGTVARLHRSDVRPHDEPAAVPAPGDAAGAAAYKERLRDNARQRGLLK